MKRRSQGRDSSGPPRSPWPLLLRWYRQHGRTLPWRSTRDPYAILVSEIMLQQTQVQRVLGYFQRWMEAFPSFQALAAAPRGRMLRLWSGLGYNRRPLMLQQAARAVVRDGMPRTAAEWEELPGIGPYTAGAVAIFSQNEAILPIDTNIRRVLSRVLLGVPFPQPSHDDQIRRQGAAITRTRTRAEVVQGLFDLGATVCRKRPSCQECPLRASCRAASLFIANEVHVPRRSIQKSAERRFRDKPYPDRIYRGRVLRVLQTRRGIDLSELARLVDPAFAPALDRRWFVAILRRLGRDKLLSRAQLHRLLRYRR